jgi:hypothetical protein
LRHFDDAVEVEMSLQDDVKAKAVALVSQQMATWVVEIQRNIAKHQEELVRSLDTLQENVARYDERIDEDLIGKEMADVVAAAPVPAPEAAAPSGPGYERLRASLGELDKGASLSDVLMCLVNEASSYIDRAAMFIVKGSYAIGWYGRGFDQADAVKNLNIPLTADTVFRIVQNSRHALCGHITHSMGTAAALVRLGGTPQGILAVPLILRDKLSAILYCDTVQDEVSADLAALVESLALYASKTIDLISLGPKTGPAAARTTGGSTAERAAAIRAAAPAHAGAPAAQAPDQSGATMMFRQGATPQAQPAAAHPAAAHPAAAHATPAPRAAVAPEDQKAHDDAKKFAKLVVQEIFLYNKAKVEEGRRNRNIYEVLKEEIERNRKLYSDRVVPRVRDSTNYFFEQLVEILAQGNPELLGPM